MRTTGIAPLILVSARLVLGCNHVAPTAPSPPPAPPPPIPVTSMWNITVRLVAVAGGECVGETTLPCKRTVGEIQAAPAQSRGFAGQRARASTSAVG